MKGIILAGGTGSRLHPLTKITNKHLLPIYNKPMVYYPLLTLREAGIKDVLIVSGRGHAGRFLDLLGSGSDLGLNLVYEVQEEAGGIAQALGLARSFAAGEKIAVVLGDNIFEDDIKSAVDDFAGSDCGAMVFLKAVKKPQAYGVAELENNKIVSIVEKPENPMSNFAVTGCYMYDEKVFEVIDRLKPSDRNELEITDVNNYYLKQGNLDYRELEGFWGDCGESFDSLMEASMLVRNSRLSDVRIHKDLSGAANEKHSINRVNSL